MGAPSGRTDAELVSATSAGDHEAYKELVARYQGHVYGLAYSLVSNWTDAQDIAQETFIRAYCNLDRLRAPARFAGWLRRVTFGTAMDWLRAFRPKLFAQMDGRVNAETLEIADFRPGPPEIAAKRELAEAVMKAIASLPPKYRVPLTMFHLDGLSYEKVAGFLDIPLGTAKSLIHRAQQKLRALLPAAVREEMTMVQEVFDEHKLPADFARQVLQNVPRLRYDQGETTLAGAITACMQFLKENVTYDYVMGVSGGAFKLLWHPDWCPSSGDLILLAPSVLPRTFAALGRDYEHVHKTGRAGEEQEFRRRIQESITKGLPVLAEGVVGPETCLVAGFDQEGSILLGHSYFHDGAKGYYEKPDWFKDCRGLILVGEKKEPAPRSQVLRDSLAWAIELAQVPQRRGYVSGLAAYDAWAAALRRDDFPQGDLEKLTFRCLVNANVVHCVLLDARRCAAKFLRGMADVSPAAAPHLLAAAAAYEEEHGILNSVSEEVPYSYSPKKRRLQMADPGLRHRQAEVVLQAKQKEECALAQLERALRAMA